MFRDSLKVCEEMSKDSSDLAPTGTDVQNTQLNADEVFKPQVTRMFFVLKIMIKMQFLKYNFLLTIIKKAHAIHRKLFLIHELFTYNVKLLNSILELQDFLPFRGVSTECICHISSASI